MFQKKNKKQKKLFSPSLTSPSRKLTALSPENIQGLEEKKVRAPPTSPPCLRPPGSKRGSAVSHSNVVRKRRFRYCLCRGHTKESSGLCNQQHLPKWTGTEWLCFRTKNKSVLINSDRQIKQLIIISFLLMFHFILLNYWMGFNELCRK